MRYSAAPVSIGLLRQDAPEHLGAQAIKHPLEEGVGGSGGATVGFATEPDLLRKGSVGREQQRLDRAYGTVTVADARRKTSCKAVIVQMQVAGQPAQAGKQEPQKTATRRRLEERSPEATAHGRCSQHLFAQVGPVLALPGPPKSRRGGAAAPAAPAGRPLPRLHGRAVPGQQLGCQPIQGRPPSSHWGSGSRSHSWAYWCSFVHN